jgi:hypothetical protein
MMAGTLVVHCANRPKDDVIEVSLANGPDWFVNNHIYKNVEGIEGEVAVGTPIPSGHKSKLPSVDDRVGQMRLVKDVLGPLDPNAPPPKAPKPAASKAAPETEEASK